IDNLNARVVVPTYVNGITKPSQATGMMHRMATVLMRLITTVLHKLPLLNKDKQVPRGVPLTADKQINYTMPHL
ncbi:hypothetical protein, partial [Staphylococcus aureus]